MTRKAKKENSNDGDRAVVVLEEILRWIKVTSIPHVKQLLESLPLEEKIAYHFSDGRSSREVAKIVNVHFTTVVGWWKKWYTKGIVEVMRVKRGTRYKHVFSLEDFDIEIPKLPQKKIKKEEDYGSGEGR